MIQIRPMHSGEEEEVIRLVRQVFYQQVAPGYKPEGSETFHRYADAGALSARRKDHTVMVAILEEEIIGVLEMRGTTHLAMLFVEQDCQRRGVGSALFEAAMKHNLAENPDLDFVTVHASPNAVDFYKTLGFETKEPEQETDGIRYTPMILDLWR